MTCLIGVAVYPQDAKTRSELVEAADRAMYASKRLGRNQVRSINDKLLATLDIDHEQSREEQALQGTVEALSSLIEARDAYTRKHTDGVELFANKIAQTLGLGVTEIRIIRMVGRLHDIGKVAIPDAFLHKPGSLTEEELGIMRKHPVIGAEVVSRIPSLRVTAPGIRGHHERWDGTGYPDGLAGLEIPLAARNVAVADAYSAITTNRPYRNAGTQEDALNEMSKYIDTQFDPGVMAALEKVIQVMKLETEEQAFLKVA